MSKIKMCPASFIPTEKDRLGLTWEELADRIGISTSALHSYVTKGQCPVLIRVAVNGLLAEQSIGGARQIKGLPAVIPQPVHGRRGLRVQGHLVPLMVMVPPHLEMAIRAVTASLGCVVAEMDRE